MDLVRRCHKKRLVVWLLFILCCAGLSGMAFPEAAESRIIKGGVTTAWVNRYREGDDLLKEVNALAVDDQGNVYVSGGSVYGGDGASSCVTLKLNSMGQVVWARYYEGKYPYNNAKAMAVDPRGNVFSTGYSGFGSHYSGYHSTIATFKLGPDGEPQWWQTFGDPPGEYSDFANAMAVDGQGNVYITGTVTIKYSPDGQELWVRNFNGVATAIGMDSQANVYVTGYSYSFENYDYLTIKYGTDGQELWARRYNGPGNRNDYPSALVVDSQGNVYITGTSWNSESGDDDCVTIKYSADGQRLWVRRSDAGGWPNPGIALDGLGNTYVTGNTGRESIVTVKYNPEGQKLWGKRFSGPLGSSQANAMTVDSRGNVYITGSEWGSEPNIVNCLTIKYNTDGRRIWVRRYHGPENAPSNLSAVALDGQGNIYVSGVSYISPYKHDFLTIKYLQNP